MLKAQQNQLAQAANSDLVEIRMREIDYYVQFFTQFGTQCALIAGFQLSSISQVPTWDATNNEVYIWMYWVSASISVIISIHVLLCSVYATVFGQGLALRGPTGSMIKAVDGMMDEQRHILWAFSANLFFLGISTITTYYVVMDLLWAHICGCLTLIGMYYWHTQCLRIYNRFKWVEEGVSVFEGNEVKVDSRPRDRSFSNEIYARSSITGSNVIRDHRHSRSRSSRDSSHRRNGGFFGMFRKRKKHDVSAGSRSAHEISAIDDAHADSNIFPRSQSATSFHGEVARTVPRVASRSEFYDHDGDSSHILEKPDILFQSYITLIDDSSYFRMKSQRVYMVIFRNKLLWYANKKEYECDPENPLNNRPVYIDNYVITTNKSQGNVYELTLTPDTSVTDGRKVFSFRCDTHLELAQWVRALQSVARIGTTSGHSVPLLASPSNVTPSPGGCGDSENESVRNHGGPLGSSNNSRNNSVSRFSSASKRVIRGSNVDISEPDETSSLLNENP